VDVRAVVNLRRRVFSQILRRGEKRKESQSRRSGGRKKDRIELNKKRTEF
jgi:hypothetical protein